jgi:hypothetical protein
MPTPRAVSLTHDALLTRIRAEFLEMPGLRLTREQAQRLWGVERAVCQQLLDALVETQFLCARPDGIYRRGSDGPAPLLRADL